MGRRPCSSASMSDGLAEWNAPEQMNRMWSVLTVPCLVCTAEPSMMGSRSRCTPCELGSPVRQGELRELTILSISSMNTMPSCSAVRIASRVTASLLMTRSASASSSRCRASATRILRRSAPLPLACPPLSERIMDSRLITPPSSPPRPLPLPSPGGTSTSTCRSSSAPERYSSLNVSRISRPACSPTSPARMTASAFSAVAAATRSRSLLLTRPIAASTRSLTMSSTSRPT
mmetsp:Transcript_13952/g.34374  ORF Transcript_13952/g.34374 Transcript_13952/m.34374 type:complete len:232 (-) Transcript_13952:832-1527(-)